ncbi:MAG: acyltransferase family protein [Bacteroidetes bacterium]|nr:acyltransferase family protein [Bacteroidota bacterium]MBS1540195.1 acyltransferase family protein [Bacteroidota bacterium]
MTESQRRYDIDWIRVIAIGLLVVYHSAICFQPWGRMIGFITTDESWVALWTPMVMLNVWRIPLLFFVSGMGVYFALQNKTWKQLIAERTLRILVPFIFGMFCIVPIHIYIWQSYYSLEQVYTPDTGHLWFLGNIFIYVLIFAPLFLYLKKNENGKTIIRLKKTMSSSLSLLPFVGAFVVEALIIRPIPYELYAMTKHGFFLGLLAFFAGFFIVFSGEEFWKMVTKWRWLFFSVAVVLFLWRVGGQWNIQSATYLIPIESCCWIFSILSFGHLYLNYPSKTLSYLSGAAYPVYILHMIFLFLGGTLFFSLSISIEVRYILCITFTLFGSLITYEIIKRIKIFRFLFGMKYKT